MAAATAHIVGSGATSPEMVDKFLAHLKKQYATGAPEKRVMVAEVAEALVKSPGSKDLVGRVIDSWLPVVAIGRQAAKPVRDGQQGQGQGQQGQVAEDECEADMWAAVWSAYVNVESTGIRLYGVETAKLVSEWLASTQDWHLQDQLAKTLDWLIRATPAGSGTAPTTSLTQGLSAAISDATLARIVQLAMGQKREALLKGAVAAVAFKVRVGGAEANGQVAEVAREFVAWLVSEIVKASRGHPMLTDLVTQMGDGELAAHLITQEMVDALVSTGHTAITKPSKRAPKPDVAVDMWACFATLLRRPVTKSGASSPPALRLSDPVAFLAVAQHACDVSARNLAVTAIHHVKQLLPMFAALGMDLKYIVQDVGGFPAKLETTGATSGDAQMVAVALVHLAAVAAGVPLTGDAEGLEAVDAKAVAAVRPWVKGLVGALVGKSGMVPVVHDELVKLGKALQ
ncbi:hypothetical protein BCR44DRAFT_358263 [Catenaria anguillulae PL171]|uniref:Uncharacterized protein n=1 Tax=Catenaria anguillulae PL171 TaxID=765915 RepID=A0A1Y2H7H2_9FUNG|nr:hypothetical protein BCR44DRAFT_358263 [Catenaria anguillulae PL171]